MQSGEHLKIRRGVSLRLSAEAAGKLTYADDKVRAGMDEIAERVPRPLIRLAART
jgi:hypothetical protein